MPSTLTDLFLDAKSHWQYFIVPMHMPFPFCFCRFIVPMKNGDLDGKGLLASIIQAEGTVESFKVRFIYPFMKNKWAKAPRNSRYISIVGIRSVHFTDIVHKCFIRRKLFCFQGLVNHWFFFFSFIFYWIDLLISFEWNYQFSVRWKSLHGWW